MVTRGTTACKRRGNGRRPGKWQASYFAARDGWGCTFRFAFIVVVIGITGSAAGIAIGLAVQALRR
jgi:hypothetical protein